MKKLFAVTLDSARDRGNWRTRYSYVVVASTPEEAEAQVLKDHPTYETDGGQILSITEWDGLTALVARSRIR